MFRVHKRFRGGDRDGIVTAHSRPVWYYKDTRQMGACAIIAVIRIVENCVGCPVGAEEKQGPTLPRKPIKALGYCHLYM